MAGYALTCPVDKTINRFACEHHGTEVSAKQEREMSESSRNRLTMVEASSAAMAAGRGVNGGRSGDAQGRGEAFCTLNSARGRAVEVVCAGGWRLDGG